MAPTTTEDYSRFVSTTSSEYAVSEVVPTAPASTTAGDQEECASICMVASPGNLLVTKNRQLYMISLRTIETEASRCSAESTNTGGSLFEGFNAVWNIERFLEDEDTITLETDVLCFDVKHLTIAPNGRLVVAIGERELSVIALPVGRGQHRPNQRLLCFGQPIGKKHHHVSSSRILKVEWHPLSDAGVHLAVLTEDGLFRMYDLGGNLNEPELLLDLKARLGYEQRSQKAAFSRSTFSAEVDAAEFATFTFGKSDNGWSSLSIYVLMANGDLYSVCPILPSHSKIRYAHAVEMLSNAMRERDELGFTDHRDRALFLDHIVEWLTHVLHQETVEIEVDRVESDATSHKGKQPAETETFIILKDPQHIHSLPEPHARGPYLFQPAPWEVDGEVTFACDIICLPTTPVDVIVIAHTSGKLDVCLAVDSPKPSFGAPFWEEDVLDLPSMAVHECLHIFQREDKPKTLDGPIHSDIRLCLDPEHIDLFYCYSEHGVYMIDVKPWIETLQNWWNGNLSPELEQVSLPASDITCLLRSASEQEYSNKLTHATLFIVGNATINHSMLYISSLEQLVFYELMPRETGEQVNATHRRVMIKGPSLPEVFERESANSTSGKKPYTTLLEMHDTSKQGSGSAAGTLASLNERARSLRSSAMQRIPMPAAAQRQDKEGVEARLEHIKSLIEAYVLRMKSVREAIHYMNQRVKLQRKEFERQQEMLRRINRQINVDLPKRMEKTSVRMEELLKQQMKMLRNADLFTSRVTLMRSPRLSDKEREVFAMFQALYQKTNQMRERLQPISSQIRNARATSREMEQTLSEAMATMDLGATHRKEVEHGLDTETLLLDHAFERLERLSERVRQLGINSSDPDDE